ncbi:MAG: ester cyclase [Candidatus Heimdallarchaeota archaeon]|nr:ester cyclase [Candidatus Heimdallarchaeota archaeon]
MDDHEILQRYHTQERNKEVVIKYIQALNENNWSYIKQTLYDADEDVFTSIVRKSAIIKMGFDNLSWATIRTEEFNAYEKFTQFRQILEKSYSVTLMTPSNAEEISETDIDKNKILQILKALYSTRHTEIVQLMAEGDQIMCRLLFTDSDPKTGREVKYAGNTYFYLKNGDIVQAFDVLHFFGSLIQLGKLISESQEDSAKEYIHSLKLLGIIE